MDKIVAAAEARLVDMGEANGTAWRDIVADGREALFVMLDRLAEAGALDAAELGDAAKI